MKNIRIEKIADMVKEGMIVADIGTDHAFLPILLVSSGKAERVYACDVAEGPLKAAAENIRTAQLQDNIMTILSDGLQNVPDDTECIVIAGMGFFTASMILSQAEERIKKMKQIIVEVNKDVADLRRWINERQYTIDDEKFIYDHGHEYVAVSFNPEHHDSYTEEQLLLGPILMEQEDAHYCSYCLAKMQKMEEIIKQSNGTALNASQIKQDINIYHHYLDHHSQQ